MYTCEVECHLLMHGATLLLYALMVQLSRQIIMRCNCEKKSDTGRRIALHQISLFVVGIRTSSDNSTTLFTDIVRHPSLTKMSETFNAQ